MQTIIRQYQDKPLQDPDISFLYVMIQFLWTTIQERWKQQDLTGLKLGEAGDSVVSLKRKESASCCDAGILLPLHCGHNRNFSDHEKNHLTAMLKAIDFID